MFEMTQEPNSQTSWTNIRGAADGDAESRNRFAATYEPVVSGYLNSRWATNKQLSGMIEDAVQDVFIECFRPAGVLDKIDSTTITSFRAYLFGVIQNIARRHESKASEKGLNFDLEANETSASAAYDRQYAAALMREASFIQAAVARQKGELAVRRVELLHLRFGESLPIREIARRWQVDAAWLHHQYATAREEFHEALRSLIKRHNPTLTAAEIDNRCEELLLALAGA
jgi:RNA polymerase sigma factor (sigma-70 family)